MYFPDLIRTDIAWSQKEILVEEDAVFDEPPHHRVSGYQVDTRNKSRRNSSFPHSRHAMVFPRVCAATVDKIRTSILQLGLLQSWGSALQIKRIHPKSGSTLTGVTNNVMIIRWYPASRIKTREVIRFEFYTRFVSLKITGFFFSFFFTVTFSFLFRRMFETFVDSWP